MKDTHNTNKQMRTKKDKQKQKAVATSTPVPSTPVVAIPVPALQPTPGNPNKKIGINLAGNSYYSTEIPFADVFKSSSDWVFNGDWSCANADQFPLDAQGYPLEILPGQKAETLMLRVLKGYYPAGKYVVTYEGTGIVELAKFDVISSAKPQPGRIEVEVKPGDNGLVLEILESKKGDHIRNIHVWLPGLENTSSEFNPKFINLLKPFGNFRFMDLQTTNDNPLIRWENRPLPSDSRYTSSRGVPLEVMLKLANMTRTNPWFCIPHQADDTFVRNFAETVKNTLDPNLKVYIEYSNEVWNRQFKQAQYAQEKGLALGLSSDGFEAQLRFYSQRAVEVFKIWEQVFGQPSRLVRVMGSQAANSWVSDQLLAWKDAKDHVDALAVAPYFGGAFGTNSNTAQMTIDQLFEGLKQDLDNENLQWIKSQVSVAKKYNIKLIAYEGGQHLVGVAGNENNDSITNLFFTANRHPAMYDLYQRHLNNWFAEGGDLYMIFSFVGLPSKWGSWGIMEYLDQPIAEAHKYRAVIEAKL